MVTPVYLNGKQYPSFEAARNAVRKMCLISLAQTKSNLELWIQKYVPKRTGQLQDNLLYFLSSSTTRYGRYEVQIKTDVPYAGDISGNVKHYQTWLEHSGRWAKANYYNNWGMIFLHDPEAIVDWMDVLPQEARRELLDNLLMYRGLV